MNQRQLKLPIALYVVLTGKTMELIVSTFRNQNNIFS